MKVVKNWFFTITRTASKPGTRFLRLDRPDENTYRRLIDSVPFFLEEEDRAKPDQQGLVHAATDTEAKQYDDGEISYKTKAVQPHQLPEVAPAPSSFTIDGNPFAGNTTDVSVDSTETRRNRFLVSLSSAFVSFLNTVISGLRSSISALESAVTAIQNTISSLQADVSNLQNDVTSIQNDISTLQNDVNTAQITADSAYSMSYQLLNTLKPKWLGNISTNPISINYNDGTNFYGLLGFSYAGTATSVTINIDNFWYPAREYTLLVWNSTSSPITITLASPSRGIILLFDPATAIPPGKNVIYTIQDWNPNLFIARAIQP